MAGTSVAPWTDDVEGAANDVEACDCPTLVESNPVIGRRPALDAETFDGVAESKLESDEADKSNIAAFSTTEDDDDASAFPFPDFPSLRRRRGSWCNKHRGAGYYWSR